MVTPGNEKTKNEKLEVEQKEIVENAEEGASSDQKPAKTLAPTIPYKSIDSTVLRLNHLMSQLSVCDLSFKHTSSLK